jgi:hypothetical protein
MKPHKSKKKQTNEGLVNMMKNVLVRRINLDMAHTPASQVEKDGKGRMRPFTP